MWEDLLYNQIKKQEKNFVKIKLSPVQELIEGKKIIVVDDSIVRGTTTKEKN